MTESRGVPAPGASEGEHRVAPVRGVLEVGADGDQCIPLNAENIARSKSQVRHNSVGARSAICAAESRLSSLASPSWMLRSAAIRGGRSAPGPRATTLCSSAVSCHKNPARAPWAVSSLRPTSFSARSSAAPYLCAPPILVVLTNILGASAPLKVAPFLRRGAVHGCAAGRTGGTDDDGSVPGPDGHRAAAVHAGGAGLRRARQSARVLIPAPVCARSATDPRSLCHKAPRTPVSVRAGA